MENYVNYMNGCADTIKFSPLMKTDMFNTKDQVLNYTHKVCYTNEQIKQLYDKVVNKYDLVKENKGVFVLIPYKEININGQDVILKYMQVEDTYDLDKVIETLKLYYNGNLSNKWNFKENILDEF